MKIFQIFALNLFLVFCSCQVDDNILITDNYEKKNQFVIGKMINNKPIITTDSKEIISHLQKSTAEQRIKLDISDLEIIEHENGNLILRGQGENYTSNSMLSIIRDNVIVLGLDGRQITCSSTDCANNDGCVPDTISKCTACTGTCTKTTTFSE